MFIQLVVATAELKCVNDIVEKELCIGCLACVQLCPQTAILAAVQPDAIVLVVNVYDSEEYIIRTIQFAESVTDSHVVCLALSFNNVQASFSPLEENIVALTDAEIIEHTCRISTKTGISCFSVNQTDAIFDTIVNYLSQEL